MFKRLAGIMQRYENLRHANAFDESVKAELRKPGAEFTLREEPSGEWRFYRAHYDKKKFEAPPAAVHTVRTENPFQTSAAEVPSRSIDLIRSLRFNAGGDSARFLQGDRSYGTIRRAGRSTRTDSRDAVRRDRRTRRRVAAFTSQRRRQRPPGVVGDAWKTLRAAAGHR